MKCFFIDHYDSFSFNVIDLLERAGVEQIDHVYFDKLGSYNILDYDFAVLSPGPKHPSDAKSSIELFKKYSSQIPFLGICLGHQIICMSQGSEICEIPSPHHGSKMIVSTESSSVMFKGLPKEVGVATYNSLGAYADDFKTESSGFKITAISADGIIQGLERKVDGMPYVASMQFHPESFLSEHSLEMVKNFLSEIK